MKNPTTLRRIFILATLVVLLSVIAVGVYSRASNSQKKRKYGRTYDAAKVTEVPKVESRVEGLEVAGYGLINQGTPDASLFIDVINHREEAVMALDFIAGTEIDYGGQLHDGLYLEDNPTVIIPPHSLRTFTWHLGAIDEGEIVRVAAAVFSDGKEAGERQSLESMKKGRLRDQEKRRAEKARNGGLV